MIPHPVEVLAGCLTTVSAVPLFDSGGPERVMEART